MHQHWAWPLAVAGPLMILIITVLLGRALTDGTREWTTSSLKA